MTLDEARAEYFAAARLDGMACPCCERFGKFYVVSLNKSLITTLAYLYHHARREFIHMPSKGQRAQLKANNVGKLALWGFAEAATQPEDPTKRRLGYWRITARGVAFLEDELRAWQKAVCYNGAVVEWITTKTVGVTDALPKKFDYGAMMRERPPPSPAVPT